MWKKWIWWKHKNKIGKQLLFNVTCNGYKCDRGHILPFFLNLNKTIETKLLKMIGWVEKVLKASIV
jgi:hypothetical protein